MKKEIELTTEEANMYQLNSMHSNPDYHIEEIDKDLGTKYEAKLGKDKHGNVYLKTKTRYGGFYYLGSLLAVILLTIATIASIRGIVDFIKNKDYINIIMFGIFVFPICFVSDIYCIKELISEIKEKLTTKRLIKEGKIKKEKRTVMEKLYRCTIYNFLAFLIFSIFGLIMQESGHSLSSDFSKNILIILFTSFCTLAIIILIYTLYLNIKKYKN